MASPKNSMYVALRPEKDGKPGQRDLLLDWKETKRFQISAFLQDCIEILEEHPELLDTARPGAELARALDRAEIRAEIVVEREWMGDGWQVYLKDQKGVWERGDSQVEALGKWIVTHPEHSGLKIHWPPMEGAPRER